MSEPAVSPAGDPYDWYTRGVRLLQGGNAAAAAALLEHAASAEPGSRSVREALARAQYAAGNYGDALESFASIVDEVPTDDYAHFGLGLAAVRTGALDRAVEHLALAAAMRPDNKDYGVALRSARAYRVRQEGEEPPTAR